jgi:carbohydrate-binding DOMON domain-containing protein
MLRLFKAFVRGVIMAAVALLTASPVFASFLNVTDLSNDDNGPGNYVYPTNSSFVAGAFDITRFQIFEDATTAYFLLQTRDLTPTFGSPLGAQLIDVYLHDPSAAVTSTSAASSQRNYSIAPADAWSRRIEVQGFGQQYVDASGTTRGTVAISTDASTNTIMFTVPAATLGQIGAGWSVVVTLTGQDGFSLDQARGFAPTPAEFLFGVCAAPSSDPHCLANPNSVPKVIDTLTPEGIAQSTELDYTRGPVVLHGVAIPDGGTPGAPEPVPELPTFTLLAAGSIGIAVALRRRR